MEIDLDELQINNPENEYNLPENFIFINEIDQGAFAKVIHVKDIRTKKDFALKIITKSEYNTNYINKMKEDINILKKLHHENIVKYYGYIETINQLLIKMEYIKYGTLEKWLKRNKTNIIEEEASLIIKKVLSAIAYLHQHLICHRDLKPENIMFSKENDLNSIKIIDFGLSLQNCDSLCNSDYCGTLIYMAPEQIDKKSYYLSVDIWSVGILMFMLLNKGEHPFYNEEDTQEIFLRNLKENKKKEFNNKISYMAINLMNKLLEYDPIKRYKASDALKHPWITRNPEDNIPQTFNEQLNTFSIVNNAKKLMMISIFLNYFKINNLLWKDKNETKRKECKKSKSIIYKIDDEYIKKCQLFSKEKKDKLKELRIEYMDTKNEKEKSKEKNNNSNANTNSSSNNNISNSNSSKSNNKYFMKHCNTTNSLNIKQSKIYLKNPKIKKDTPLVLIKTNYLTTKRVKKKIYFSESKRNNINNYNNKGKKLNIETEFFKKENLSNSKKRKLFLIKTSTKAFNSINENEKNQKALIFINKNVDSFKPINLFLREKNLNKLQKENQIYKPNIFLANAKVINKKNYVDKNSLPNISNNHLHNNKNSKRKKKYIFN